MKEKINKFISWFENLFLSNMTLVIIFLIIWIIISKLLCWISIEYMFTSVWAILAFWYWYKRYERDKEVKMFDKYLLWDLTIENLNEIQKWLVAFELNKSQYMSDKVFNLVDIHNNNILIEFIKENLLIYWDDDKIEKVKNLSNWLSNFITYPDFYNYIKATLRKYLEILPSIIQLEDKEIKVEELKKIKKNLELLLEAMGNWDNKIKSIIS